MDNVPKSTIREFTDHVSRSGDVTLSHCGVDESNKFVFGYSVKSNDHGRLLMALHQHPSLTVLVGKTIVTRQDVTHFYAESRASGYSGVGNNSLYPQLPASSASPYTGPQAQTGYAATPVYPPRCQAQGFGATGGYSNTSCTDSSTAYTRYSARSSGSSTTSRTTGTYSTPAPPKVVENTSLQAASGLISMVLDDNGMLGYAKCNNLQPYALVTSVDPGMTLMSGIAKVVAEKAGDKYVKISKDNAPSFPGACFTYRCSVADRKLSASGLSNCKNIHNVYVPQDKDTHYQETLKNTFINIFTEAKKNGNHSLICCFLGCGNAGGSGDDLATAVHDARLEFLKTSKEGLVNLTLVGMNKPGDRKIHGDFLEKWRDLENQLARKPGKVSSQSGRRLKKVHSKEIAVINTTPETARRLATQASSTTLVAATTGLEGCSHTKMLIPGMLDVVMHRDGGMFGVVKALSKQGESFDLVNAANRKMNHSGGIAGEFVKRFSGFSKVTTDALQDPSRKGDPIRPGGCLTINIKNSQLQSPSDLAGCKNIHNVVAPIFPGKGSNEVPSIKEQKTYDKTFREAFVSLLRHAHVSGGHKVVSCFIGCAIFGGDGTAMAKALHAAYHSTRIQSLSKIPKLVLAGWDVGSGDDKKVYDDFIKEFERRQQSNPVNLYSGRLSSHAGYSPSATGIGYPTGTGATPKRQSSAYSGSGTPAVGIQKTHRSRSGLPSYPSSDSSTNSSLVTRRQGSETRELFDPLGIGAKAKSKPLSRIDKRQKTSMTGTSGKSLDASGSQNPNKQDVTLEGNGMLGCYDTDETLTQDERHFIEDGIKNNKFKLVQSIPADEAYEKNKGGKKEPVNELILMEPLKNFRYGQLLSYKVGKNTCYLSVDSVKGVYKSHGCFICPGSQKLIFGTRKGDQPTNGTMSRHIDTSVSLSGYLGSGMIVIDYHFPDGTQSEQHRNPGSPYTGTTRRAYLPNNQEGREVFTLLKTAFNRRLTFTVGTSTTHGAGGGDRVTWNDIHHKTSMRGGAQSFGYPDPTYLSRVKEELKAKGVEIKKPV